MFAARCTPKTLAKMTLAARHGDAVGETLAGEGTALSCDLARGCGVLDIALVSSAPAGLVRPRGGASNGQLAGAFLSFGRGSTAATRTVVSLVACRQ